MCGICGIIHLKGGQPDQLNIERMMASINHRGPNDRGMLIEKQVGLGFVRLSIIDLSPSGHQPMFSADERFAIIYNGEVYNYVEIRDELVKKGHRFRSKTDTEVVLAAYIEWGEACLHKFNGMWAMVIYDRQNGELFCARDRFGVKPFYYSHSNGKFIFGSEIQSILTTLDVKPTANTQSLFDYMVYNRTDQSDSTFFNEIKKLPHAHAIRIRIADGTIKISKWYDLKSRIDESMPFESPEAMRDTFQSAIALRLRSDVPVGVCLSGGLDSSSIVSMLLNKFGKSDLNTFSAVYDKGQKGDESEFINEYRPLIEHMHFVTPTADSFYKDLSSFVYTHAEPFPTTSIYAHYKVMEMAQKHVVVTLDGQGADEEMGGYHYFFGFYFKELLRKMRFVKLASELKNYWANHHSLYGIKSLAYFVLPENSKRLVRIKEKGYLTKDFSSHEFPSVISNTLYGSADMASALFNHFEYKLEHLLKWQDLNSMRFSIEARVPFLDYRMVEGLLKVDSDRLIVQGMTKSILREAMKGILPEKIRMRKDKIGFETPQKEWFKNSKFEGLINDILHSTSFRDRNIVDSRKAIAMYKSHLNGKTDISKEIWKWINLELWYRRYIDGHGI